MQFKCSLKRAQVLGFTIVLILTLTLAGLTCYKGAEILGLYKTDQALDSFKILGRMINSTSVQADGTRNSLPIRIDEKSAIVGWSIGSNQVTLYKGINHWDTRPKECGGSNACICLCRDYDWSIRLFWFNPDDPWYKKQLGGVTIEGTKCKSQWMCYNYPPNIDFPRKLSDEQYGLDYDVEGGFFMARNGALGSKDIESRLKAVYVVKQGGMIGVLFNPDGLTAEVIKHHEEYTKAVGLYYEADNAFTAKNWDLAINKYNELINSKLVDLLQDYQYDQAYWYLGMAYYRKGETQNAITALQKAAEVVKDENNYNEINKKIQELGGQPSIRHEPDITMG